MPNNSNVDERVVEMRIDNRQFVSGANKTIGVLDKLKEALNFKKAGEGFDDLAKSADKVDLSGISKNLDQISERFSTMGLVGMRVINQLTDAVSGFVYRTVKDLTIGQVTAGFDKYSSLLESTRTILAATRNETGWTENYASQIDYVNDKLEQLMWFTDETSYNLSDMTSNIAKFTNAGIPLEDAVEQMEGIAVWAGLSGANANEASRAMYNLSQAIGAGKMTLMDWKSIENANMATVEFKQTVLDVAVEAGRLERTADGLYKTLSGTEVTISNFGHTLSEGWFDSDVIAASLQTFGQYTQVLKDVMDDLQRDQNGNIGEYFTTTEMSEWIHAIEDGDLTLEQWQDKLRDLMPENVVPDLEALQYAFELLTDSELDLGRRAFEASQEYKTLKDALDATRDAVSTGWTKTFKAIVGDAEQAKRVWTYVGDELYDVFAESGNRRNAILKLWAEQTFDEDSGVNRLMLALRDLYEGIRTYIDPIREAFSDVFSWGTNSEAAAKLVELTDRFGDFAKRIALSDRAVEGLGNLFYSIFDFIKRVGSKGKPVLNFFKNIFVYGKRFVETFLESFAGEDGFRAEYFLENMSLLFGDIGEGIRGAWDSLKQYVDQLKQLPIWGNAVEFISETFGSIKNSVFDILGIQRDVTDETKNTLKPIDVLSNLLTVIQEKLSGLNFDSIRGAFGKVGDIFATLLEGLTGDAEVFKQRVKDMLTNAWAAVREFLSGIKLSDVFGAAKNGIVAYLALEFANFVKAMKDSTKEFKSIPESISGMFNSISDSFKTLSKSVKAVQIFTIAAAIAVVAASMWLLSKVPEDKFMAVAITLGVLFAILGRIVKGLSDVQMFSNNAKKTIINVIPKFAASMISVAILFVAVASSLLMLKDMQWPDIIKGLFAIFTGLGVAIVALSFLSKKLDDGVNVKAIGKIAVIGLVLRSAGKALAATKDLSVDQIFMAGLMISAILGLVTAIMYVSKESSMGSGGGALLVLAGLAAMIYVLIPALTVFAAFSWDMIGRALSMVAGIAVTMALFIGILANIGKSGGALKGAGALAIVAASMVLFAFALTLTAPALIAIVGAFSAIIDWVNSLESVGSAILILIGFGVALAVIGAAGIAAGAALVIIAAGFALFSVGALAAGVALGLLAAALVPFGMALTEFLDMVAENGKVLVALVTVVIASILTAIVASKLNIGLALVSVILTVLLVIHDYGPLILDVIGILLEDVMKFLFGLIPMLIKALVLAVILIINGTADAIRSNSDAIVSAIENLISSLLELVLKVFFQMAGDLLGGLWSLVAGLFGMDSADIDAVADEINTAFGQLGNYTADRVNVAFGGAKRESENAAGGMIDGMTGVFTDRKDDVSGSLTEITDLIYGEDRQSAFSSGGETLGSSLLGGITSGVDMNFPGLETYLGGKSDSIVSAFDRSSDAETDGSNFIAGITSGMMSQEGNLTDVSNYLASIPASAFASVNQINSPSKIAMGLGRFWDLGLAGGLEDGSKDVYSQSEELAFKMAETTRNALSTVAALASEDFSISPVITPVVDMTGVDETASTISNLFANTSNQVSRVSRIGRNISDIEDLASNMQTISEARANTSQDVYEVNIYSQPGMDEEMLADAVVERLSNGVVRKGVSLG